MFTNPSDFLRKIVSRKLSIEDHEQEFNEIYGKIRTQIVRDDMAREEELERRRELLAQFVERQMSMTNSKAKIKPEMAHK